MVTLYIRPDVQLRFALKGYGAIMKIRFNPKATKKSTNLSLNSELLAEARRLNIDLSATLEKALEQEISRHLQAEWLQKNAEAIAACNELTEKHGLFSDSFRKVAKANT
ncbi:hypothetical protein GCM10009426_26740 [Rheinheimera tangshanensis]|nr:hypothetical protein GCM10010920_24870 [Rheinheimera tangshanensis]